MSGNVAVWNGLAVANCRLAKRPDPVPPVLTDTYEFSAPSYQNAIDLLPGWNHAFPAEMKLNAGPGFMYEDPRIYWAAEQAGGLEGKRVLELGPLEGSHTYMLERLGARRIDAVEANKSAYLRCLVAKEIWDCGAPAFTLAISSAAWRRRRAMT